MEKDGDDNDVDVDLDEAPSSGHSMSWVPSLDQVQDPTETSTPSSTLSPDVLLGVDIASGLTLSPGRVRRRSSVDEEGVDQILDVADEPPSRHPQQSPLPSRELEMPVLSPVATSLGQAPIPFRTSFLPTNNNTLDNDVPRPEVLPYLSRYTHATETAPTDLPIYQRYRQVRRRTGATGTLATTSISDSADANRSTLQRADDPTYLEPRAHPVSRSQHEHRVPVLSQADAEAEAEAETERPDVPVNSPDPSGTGTTITPSAFPQLPTRPAPITVPVPVPSRTTVSPPTPPALFMATNGLGQYSAADTGIVPPFPPTSNDTSAAPFLSFGQRSQQVRAHMSAASHRPQVDRNTTDMITSSGDIVMTTHTPNMDHFMHQQTPLPPVPSPAPALLGSRAVWHSEMPPLPPPTDEHISWFDLPGLRSVDMQNQFAFYYPSHGPRRIPHLPHASSSTESTLPNMPARAESLYSRLARLDSLRSENPVHRGEQPRPYLPVNEMTSTRRSVHQGRVGTTHHHNSHLSNLPPIPPFGHDGGYRPDAGLWNWRTSSIGQSDHGRDRSRGASGASLSRPGDSRRTASRQGQDMAREEQLAMWYNDAQPLEADAYYPPSDFYLGDRADYTSPLYQHPRHGQEQENRMEGDAPNTAQDLGWEGEAAYTQSVLGEWGDFIGQGAYEPVEMSRVHPFARSAEANMETDIENPNIRHPQRYSNTLAPLYDLMPPVPQLIPSRPPPPHDSFGSGNDHLAAFVAARSGGNMLDHTIPSGSHRARDMTLSAFIASRGGQTRSIVNTDSAPGALTGSATGSGLSSGTGTRFIPERIDHRQSQYANLGLQPPAGYRQTTSNSTINNGTTLPAVGHTHANWAAPGQIPTIPRRVLSPAFLGHYRIDKNWPIEKQKQIVRVVVRLINGFTPAHKKLEAQSVLRYVYWEDAGNVCDARGMEKESVCPVCYDDVSSASSLSSLFD